MLATHLEAERRYGELRTLALREAQSRVPGINFQTITPDALSASRSWDHASSRKVDWDWTEGYAAFRFRYPKRFELAMWQQQKLIALSMGRPTYYGNSLRLDFIEASPRELGERPPVFRGVLLAYGVYARLINAREIRITSPINDEVRAFYESYGYQYVAKHDYLYREVI